MEAIKRFLRNLFQTLFDFFKDVFDWVYDLLLWVPKKVFSLLMDGLGDAIVYTSDTVCVRACVQAVSGIGNALSNVPDVITFAFPYLHIATGVELIICAYVVRFVIRRIPFIG